MVLVLGTNGQSCGVLVSLHSRSRVLEGSVDWASLGSHALVHRRAGPFSLSDVARLLLMGIGRELSHQKESKC